MYVRTRLGRWFYEERGAPKREKDPAVVLWPSLLCDGGMWKAQIEPLAGLGRVLVFDPPGHGRSELPPVFTLEDNTDALMDALDELRVDRAVVVGLSWGGMLGMRLAVRHPTRVAALALFDTSADPEDRAKVLKYRALSSLAKRLGLPPSVLESQVAPAMFCDRTLAEKRALVDRFVRSVSGFPPEGLYRATRAVVIHRTSVLDQVAGIRAPTLVACGREDRGTPPVHSERLAAAIPGARLAWIDDAGHLSALEQPAAVNALLVPFVREQLAG